MKKILKYLGLAILTLLIVLVVKTLLYKSRQMDVKPEATVQVQEQSLTNLVNAIKFKTVSNEDSGLNDTTEFAGFQKFLETTYPFIHKTFKKEVYNKYALLFEWKGKNNSLKPAILMAHQDVVPVVEIEWQKPPFSGTIENGTVWGRGTLDNKGSMIAILESVEKLIGEGFVPERTLYLAFGDDEEVGGKGAQAIAAALKNKGVDAAMVLDEGMVISTGIVPMISKPVATIGTSEKGYLSIKLSCNVNGGHSSMPQAETAISILSEALVKITRNPMHPTFTQPVKDFMSYIGPEIPWPARIVFANRWLLGGVLKSVYTGSGPGNATVRTTLAPTIFQSGIKDNVLPTTATAVINMRLLPGDTSGEILQTLKKTIGDERVVIEALEGFREPAPVSPVDIPVFGLLEKTIKQSFENTLVAPTLMLGASDSRNYSVVSKNIYRFAPYQVSSEMLETIHGNNERINVEDFKKMIGFYYRLVKNLQSD
jgi:carboxypeptidase PM20D1